MERFQDPCTPPAWARSGHAQTIFGHLLPSPTLEQELVGASERLEIAVSSGDRLVACRFEPRVEPSSTKEARAAVYLFHGLGGSSDAAYMRRVARVALGRGHPVFLVNHRGAGLGRGLARRPYHSGIAEDLSAVLTRGRELYPEAQHVAVGFSLSANALLLLLTGKRGSAQPDAAIAVNAPINLARSSVLLAKGLNRVYDFRFLRDCRAHAGPDCGVPWYGKLSDFDELYTAPRSGFRDRHHYYAECSTHELLHEIGRPTVILMSQDDPFIDFEDYARARLAPKVFLHAEKHGGHMGYLSRANGALGYRRWLDLALDHYLGSLIQSSSASAPEGTRSFNR